MSRAEDKGLLWALRFDGRGRAQHLNWAEVCAWKAEDGFLWLHMDRGREAVQEWVRANLSERVGLDPGIDDSLLAEETRPRCEHLGDALVLVLRGVNRNEGAAPEDMVSIRLYADPTRVVSLRLARTVAAQNVVKELEDGKGPTDAGSFLVHLVARILDSISDLIVELGEELDEIEVALVAGEERLLRRRLAELRRRTVGLRRHLAPQCEALATLANESFDWIREKPRADLRQLADRLTRYVEDLDAVRDRAAVTQDEVASRTQEQLNRRILRLSLVASVFLPLSLITGLFGMNVGGIPFATHPAGLSIMIGVVLVLALLEVLLLRRAKWE
jgi:zinc transporter